MFKLLSPLAIAGALLSLACLGAAPALALSQLTFVSGKGTDTGACTKPTIPCRSFQFAINRTGPGGAVKALDPANYGDMVITQSISISGVEGASISSSIAADAITINAGANDVINLSHLTVDGVGFNVNNGIVLHSGGSLTITHCVVRNYTQNGIVLAPTGTTNFLIADALVSDNANFGILVLPQDAGLGAVGSAVGTLDHVLASKNAHGIFVATVVGGEGGA